MTMYLGMTEEDYDNVIKWVPLNVADRLGIQNASALTAEVLKQEIHHIDPTAFTLMQDFLATYQAWWQKSKEVGEVESPAPPTTRKDVTPLNRKPGGLMEQNNASLQRGDQG